MSDAQFVERFLADPVGFEVVLDDGTLGTVVAFRGNGSGRCYRLRGEWCWRSVNDFQGVMLYSIEVVEDALRGMT